jgi:hypothetical protein
MGTGGKKNASFATQEVEKFRKAVSVAQRRMITGIINSPLSAASFPTQPLLE